ncbi:MAG: hypothetical protein ACE5FO_00060 [Parvularculaceae bacterium]
MARTAARFILAAAVAALAAIGFHTATVLGRLAALGTEISAATWAETLLRNFLGLAPSYGAVVAIALALGFAVAALLKPRAGPLAPFAYPLAGAGALAVALVLMHIAYDGITPIAGARGTAGFLLQCLAGGLGGAVFALAGAAGKRR